MLTMPHVLNTAASEANSTESTILYITSEGLRNRKLGAHFYSVDGAGYHMRPSVCKSLQQIDFPPWGSPKWR